MCYNVCLTISYDIAFQLLDPVRLIGEFQFNLQSLKQISVTDSFLGLDVNSRKCQNVRTFNDCKTMLYIEKMRYECGCLPLSHILSEKVYNKFQNCRFLNMIPYKKDHLCTTKEEIECRQTLKPVNSTSCMRF